MSTLFKFHKTTHTPSIAYSENNGIITRYQFHEYNKLTSIVYNSKGIVFSVKLTDTRAHTSLYSNQETPVDKQDRLHFAKPHNITEEDKIILKLKYNINIDLLEFANGNITDACRTRIHNKVIELMIEVSKRESHTNKDACLKYLHNTI